MNPIREWRERHSLTQKEAAERLGIAPITVASIETGRRQPSWGLSKTIEQNSGGEIKKEILRPDIFEA